MSIPMTATQKKELLQAVYKRIRTELLSLSIAEISHQALIVSNIPGVGNLSISVDKTNFEEVSF